MALNQLFQFARLVSLAVRAATSANAAQQERQHIQEMIELERDARQQWPDEWKEHFGCVLDEYLKGYAIRLPAQMTKEQAPLIAARMAHRRTVEYAGTKGMSLPTPPTPQG